MNANLSTSRVRPLLVYGTRPEAIKMAPLIRACREDAARIDPIVCVTGQHREMLDQVNAYFGVVPDLDLAVMRAGQSLSELTGRLLTALDEVLERVKPDCLVAQGDTTSVFAAALAGFYRRVPLVHVEAGLRTGDLAAHWPEEMNRRFTSLVAAVHCAPTARAASALAAEGVPTTQIHMTGNTVVDALLWTLDRERQHAATWEAKYQMLGRRPLVLITGHRRENFGEGFEQICAAIAAAAARSADAVFIYPVHLNPQVREPVGRLLGHLANVHLTAPADYPEFVWLMDRARLILTDSGGVQEEAPSLGKPVLIMRTATERPEAVECGAAELVGTDREKIVRRVAEILASPPPAAAAPARNPFGDGHAAERIRDLIATRRWTDASTLGADGTR